MDAPPPGVGGRLFAANHWNGIVDPLVILTSARFDASPIAKSPLFAVPILRTILRIAEAVPVTRRRDAPDKAGADNDAVFDRVADHLAAGRNVLIFPEGTSHSEPHVLPLKTGAARMLARAHQRGARGLSLQAVALDFDAKGTFRSRAVITYGAVHDVDAIASTTSDEALVRGLTAQIASDLDALVISGKSDGELVLVRQLAEILAQEPRVAEPGSEGPARLGGALAAQTELARGIVSRARALGVEDPRYQAVAEAVTKYVAARRSAGLTEAQVARDDAGIDARRLLRGAGLLLLAPLALLGALLYFVPYRLPRLARRLAGDEEDVISTYKLGIGLVAFPLWAALLTVAAWWLGREPLTRLLGVALVLGSPAAALVWLDRLDDRRGQRLLETASTAGVRKLARLRLLRRRALDAALAAQGE